MVVHVVVLARHAVHSPLDRPVIVHMIEDDVGLGIDRALEVEQVRSPATDQDVRSLDRLAQVVGVARLDLTVRVVRFVPILGDRRLPTVGQADQQIVQATAHQLVIAVASVQHVREMADIQRLRVVGQRPSLCVIVSLHGLR